MNFAKWNTKKGHKIPKSTRREHSVILCYVMSYVILFPDWSDEPESLNLQGRVYESSFHNRMLMSFIFQCFFHVAELKV